MSLAEIETAENLILAQPGPAQWTWLQTLHDIRTLPEVEPVRKINRP